ncbi:MAG TPA: hypothetical protein VJT71_00285 [Pyrinomonadaceae bacterium]|nr:hypothetical protein [Pyrinomonadaceae bacterium]
MKTAGIVLALLFTAATASAQANFELMGAPDAAIRTVGWEFPGGSPPQPERRALSPEYQLPDRPTPPTFDDTPSGHLPTSDNPPGGRLPLRTPLKREPKRRAPVVSAYLEVENTGEKVIKAVGWEVSLIDKASGAERRRLRFRTEAEVRPGQIVAQRYEFPLDDDWRWYAAKGRGVRMVVTIERLVYAGGSEWRRE